MVKKIVNGGTIPNNSILYTIISVLLIYIVFLLYTTRQSDILFYKDDRTSNLDRFNNPYSPPLRNDYLSLFPILSSGNRGLNSVLDVRGSIPIPINVPTQGYPLDYTQIGILTKECNDRDHPLILPLMGRRCMSSRNKFQYYTISNTGSVNTKLPLKMKGRSCTTENGCDELYSGDEIYVEGYKSKFTPTIYENSTFDYIV